MGVIWGSYGCHMSDGGHRGDILGSHGGHMGVRWGLDGGQMGVQTRGYRMRVDVGQCLQFPTAPGAGSRSRKSESSGGRCA